MKSIVQFICILIISTNAFSQNKNVVYQQCESFFTENKEVNKEDIEWAYVFVPENWEKPSGKKIKLALAIIRNTSGLKNADAVVMLEGGPGASAIAPIAWWLKHPLRERTDIVLLDVRGTGFSEPRICPDLGKDIFKILAKNQERSLDEKEKVEVTLSCRQSIIERGIDLTNYNSSSISRDLHAVKQLLNYEAWNIYGVSYGTYIAQVYARSYPEDIKSLILDSPIADISEYYTKNTSNYMSSLKKVFQACEEDDVCNKIYPNLESVYYNTINKLENDPITVVVDENIVEQGEFTYNSEDFKVIIHQALYRQKLIEVLPLLIYQFYERNEDALSSLIPSFSKSLELLDYGMYYCVSCNEVLPFNSFDEYINDAKEYSNLKGGVSFYSSDFDVCDTWNNQNSTSIIADTINTHISAPTLIFAGYFDPITPSKNGLELLKKIDNSQLVVMPNYGHASGFSTLGLEITNFFINNPDQKIVNNQIGEDKISFVTKVKCNSGIAKMANSIRKISFIQLTPFLTSILILVISTFNFSILLFRYRKGNKQNNYSKMLLIACSSLGVFIIIGLIIGIINTSIKNFYILAFGLPQIYNFIFILLYLYLIILLFAVISHTVYFKLINKRIFSIVTLIANIVFVLYFIHWSIL